jgi:SAM-dependent methyltransferase
VNTAALRNPDEIWRELHLAATEPYRGAGRFAWHFARGKLQHDPVFRAMLERGYLPPRARVLDIGSGQGLLASLLGACHSIADRGHWPAQWSTPPSHARYTGIELMPRDVVRAQAAALTLPTAPVFVCADMRQATFASADVAVILDVLHYVDHAAQLDVLQRVRTALWPHGALLLRVGDMARKRAFAISRWVDHAVTRVRGHGAGPIHSRAVADWSALLEGLGFEVDVQPMSQGTPFANTLLVCRLTPPQ